MAEGDFVLEVQVVADTSRFTQQVGAAMDQASRGVVHVGTASGPIAPAQQAAIDRALGMVQRGVPASALTPAGTFRLPGGYFPQANIAGGPPGFPGPGRSASETLAGMQAYFAGAGTRIDAVEAAHNARMAARRPAPVYDDDDGGPPPFVPVGGAGRAGRRRRNPNLSLARGAVGFFGFSAVAGDMSALGRAELAGEDGNAALLQARANAVRSQALYGPMMMTDMALRGLTGRNLLGGNSPIEFEHSQAAMERAERSTQLLRGIRDDVTGGQAALRTAMTGTDFQRQIRANYEQFKQREQELKDQISDATDVERPMLQRAYGSRMNAAMQRMGAANEEVIRAGRVAVQQSRRFLPGLREAAEGRFGRAEEEDFRAGLLNDYQSALLSGVPGAESAARSESLLKDEARKALQRSNLKTLQAQTRANQIRLERGTALASQLTLLADDERVALANAVPGQEADVRSSFAAQRALAVQRFEDRRYDIRQSLDAATRQSALRTAGGEQNRVQAVLDSIITNTRAEALDLEREGLKDEAARRRKLGQQQVRELRADFYRSIQFEEVGGDRIAAGRGNPFGGIERAFKDAEKQAGQPGEGGPTSGQFGELISLMRQFFNRNFIPRAA